MDNSWNKRIEDTELSEKIKTSLTREGIDTIGQLMQYTMIDLAQIKSLGILSLRELEEFRKKIGNLPEPELSTPEEPMKRKTESKGKQQPTQIHISQLELSARAYNALRLNGIQFLSEFVFMSGEELAALDYFTKPVVNEVLQCCRDYLREHEKEPASESGIQAASLAAESISVPATEPTTQSITAAKPMADSSNQQEPKISQTLFAEEELDRPIAEGIPASPIDPIEELHLSVRSYNCLKRAGVNTVQELAMMTPGELAKIRNLGKTSLSDIVKAITYFQKSYVRSETESGGRTASETEEQEKDASPAASASEPSSIILEPLVDTRPIEVLNLSVRSYNCLRRAGIQTIQQLLDYPTEELIKIRNLGAKTLRELEGIREKYQPPAEERPQAEEVHLVTAEELQPMIMKAFVIPFKGLSFKEIKEALPENVEDSLIKQAVGSLLAERKIEYVDFRCYKNYPSFYEYFESFLEGLNDRDKEVMRRRYAGETLEAIGKDIGVTRERIRQIQGKFERKLRNRASHRVFDEDFYKAIYTKCDLPQTFWSEDLGLSKDSINYLTSTFKKGTAKPEDILRDEEIPVSLRYRVRDFLNRDKIRIDGVLLPKKRSDLEEYALRKYAQEEITFDRFIELYNGMLEANGIPFDEKLYYTDGVIRTRTNRLGDSMLCLWKQGERFRYYDVDSGDYTELLEALHLDSYQNTEASTLKYMELYPELMMKYDIRDQYELHNLLKKIAKNYGLGFITFSRQPILQFGAFDRQNAIKEALLSLSPITQTDLIDYLHQEYGYDKATAVGYLTPLGAYYHNGVYSVDYKRIPDWRMGPLMGKLTEEFYFIDEIKRIYTALFRDADPDEINPYTLKAMGFNVNSNYALQNQLSARSYFRQLLTKKEVYDLQSYLRRFGSIQMFNQTYSELKAEHRIFTFDKDQIITFSRLQRLGVTEEDIAAYCEAVRDFVEDGAYFTVFSLRQDGFSHPLENLGFGDYFYSSLIGSAEGFASQRVFGQAVLYKGKNTSMFSTADFLAAQLREYESTDLDEFIQDIEDRFGVRIPARHEVTGAIRGTELYYDSIMDKVYRDKSLYYADFDE